jgi:hypothetical protein
MAGTVVAATLPAGRARARAREGEPCLPARAVVCARADPSVL